MFVPAIGLLVFLFRCLVFGMFLGVGALQAELLGWQELLTQFVAYNWT